MRSEDFSLGVNRMECKPNNKPVVLRLRNLGAVRSYFNVSSYGNAKSSYLCTKPPCVTSWKTVIFIGVEFASVDCMTELTNCLIRVMCVCVCMKTLSKRGEWSSSISFICTYWRATNGRTYNFSSLTVLSALRQQEEGR